MRAMLSQLVFVFTSCAAFNRVRGHRECNIYPTHGHGVPDQHYTAGWRWIEKRFGI